MIYSCLTTTRKCVIALRKTMLRAHRQAWAWQDEWFGLTMEDIREIERRTQEALKRKMAGREIQENDEDDSVRNSENSITPTSSEDDAEFASVISNREDLHHHSSSSTPAASSKLTKILVQSNGDSGESSGSKDQPLVGASSSQNKSEHATSEPRGIKGSSNFRSGKPPLNSPNSSKSFELLASLRMEGLVRQDSDSGASEDEFFDCVGK